MAAATLDELLVDAAEHGRANEVAALLPVADVVYEAEPDVLRNFCFEELMQVACRRGHVEVVNLLLGRVEVNTQYKLGVVPHEVVYYEAPLFAAIAYGQLEVVEALIAAKADVNMLDFDDNAPLSYACDHVMVGPYPRPDCPIEVVQALLAANADHSAPTLGRPMGHCRRRGAGPRRHRRGAARCKRRGGHGNRRWLHADGAACRYGHLRVVQLLSSYGARRTFSSYDGPVTAEHVATEYGHHDIAAWLHFSRHLTPLHQSVWPAALDDVAQLLTPARARALLRGGADVDAAAGPGGPTPLRSRGPGGGGRRRRRARRPSSSSGQ